MCSNNMNIMWKLLVTIEQTQNLLLGFSQKVVNHVPVTSRAHGATTCLSRTIMCHTLLHNNSYLPISSTKIVLENRPKTAQIPLTIIVFYRNKRFGALEPPSVRCSCHVLWAHVQKHVPSPGKFWVISVTTAPIQLKSEGQWNLKVRSAMSI